MIKLGVAGVAAVTIAISAGAAIPARGSGGSSIAAAVPMPLDTQTAGGALRTRTQNNLPWAADYWKLSLAANARFVLDLAATNQLGAGVCVLSPTVTDYTEQKAQCLASAVTGDKTELTFVAPVDGAYTVRFAVNACQCTDPLSYTFFARVLTHTTVVLRVPRSVRASHRFALNGAVTGGATGRVAIRVAGPVGLKKVLPLRANGGFATSLSLSRRGQYTLSATFYGDGRHLASSRAVRISVR